MPHHTSINLTGTPRFGPWLVNKGKVEPKTVQSILGHNKILTTLDLYTQGDSDEMSTAQQVSADAVDRCGLEKPTQVM